MKGTRCSIWRVANITNAGASLQGRGSRWLSGRWITLCVMWQRSPSALLKHSEWQRAHASWTTLENIWPKIPGKVLENDTSVLPQLHSPNYPDWLLLCVANLAVWVLDLVTFQTLLLWVCRERAPYTHIHIEKNLATSCRNVSAEQSSSLQTNNLEVTAVNRSS